MLDVSVLLVLSARFDQSDAALKTLARRLYLRTLPEARLILDLVRVSRQPLALINHFLKELPDE